MNTFFTTRTILKQFLKNEFSESVVQLLHKSWLTQVILLIILLHGISFSQTTYPHWITQTSLPSPLTGHKTLMLPDGNILIAGGTDNAGNCIKSTYIYNFSDGSVSFLCDMNATRSFFSLVPVIKSKTSVRIYVIGGYSGASNNYRSIKSVEYLDYALGQTNFQWLNVGDLRNSRAECNADFDKNSKIIITGGFEQPGGAYRSGIKLKSTEELNVTNNQIIQTGDMSKVRAGGTLGMILNDLGNDQFIIAGGEYIAPSSTELYTGNIWTSFANPPKVYRNFSCGFADIVKIARTFGGYNDVGVPINTCEWYDVKAGWKYSPSMITARADADFTLVAGLKDTVPVYLVTAGAGKGNKLSECEYYSLPNQSNPSGVWVQFNNLNVKGSNRRVSVAGNNLPVVTGGSDAGGNPITNLEIFQPLTAQDVRFSAEEVGRISDSMVVNIRNEWLLPVRLTNFRTDVSEFFFNADTLNFIIPAGSQRQIFVRFLPNDAGLRKGNLIWNIGGITDTVKLEGTGIQSSISLVSKNISFGEIFLANDTTVCYPAIKNNGTDTTYIDSISVNPNVDFELVSPFGRTKIAPGETMTVCIRFHPIIRNTINGTAMIHIAGRSYPSSLDGKGIIRYLKGFGSVDCDTFNFVPNQSYQAILTLRNPSDRAVDVSKINITGNASNTFTCSQTTPFTVLVNDRIDIPVTFTPPAEGTYRINVEFVNNGAKDSTVIIPVCFVIRSRSVSFLNSEIDFGTICPGDTALQTLMLENPGNYDKIMLDSITSDGDNSKLIFSKIIQTELAPRENFSLPLKFSSNTPGIFSYNVVAFTSFGSTSISVKARVLPKILLTSDKQNYSAKPPSLFDINYTLSGIDITQPLLTGNFELEFNPTILNLLVIKNSNPPLDEIKTKITKANGNKTLVNITWQNPVIIPSAQLTFEFESLLGNSDNTKVIISSVQPNDFCILADTVSFTTDGVCGGKNGLINAKSGVVVTLSPNPAKEFLMVEFFGVNKTQIYFTISDVYGNLIFNNCYKIDFQSTNDLINLKEIPSGLYFYEVKSTSGILRDKILIIK